MLPQLGLLMAFQFIGEVLVAASSIPFPGPLCGMVLLLGYLYLGGGPSSDLSSVSSRLLDNLGLLFVPAGTAIVAYGTLLATDGLAIFAALDHRSPRSGPRLLGSSVPGVFRERCHTSLSTRDRCRGAGPAALPKR
jgi:holin-like protein